MCFSFLWLYLFGHFLFGLLVVIGIIRRKALIKDLAAAYHAECLTYCQELLELQRKCEEVGNLIYHSFSSMVVLHICILANINEFSYLRGFKSNLLPDKKKSNLLHMI